MARTKTYIIDDSEARFLGEYLFSHKPLATHEMLYLDEVMRTDEVLYNNSYNNSYKTPLRRPYKITDMVTVQKLLHLFNVLETIKSKEYIVNCRALLHNYLYSGYSLHDCFLNYTNSNLRFNTHIDIDCDLVYGDKCFTFVSEKNSLSYPASIRKYFENYLTDHIHQSDCEYKIISSTYSMKNKDHTAQPRFYLPISHIPEFLLSFEYYDARTFPPSYERYSDTKVRRRKKVIDKSKIYESTLQHAKNFLENSEPSNSDINKLDLNKYEKLCHIYRLDKIFLFRKLDFLSYYYQAYNSDLFLDKILSRFSLTYRESMNLKSTINELIWNDTAFIQAGHHSKYIDFMLPFDVNFQFELFQVPSYSKYKSIDGLKQMIDDCKRNAQIFWQLNLPFNFKDFLVLENKSLDIYKTQDKIMDMLNLNAFFLNYYMPLLKDIPNFKLSDATQQPIPFDILKELLPQ